ncbi:hypothetical protein [Streptomyces chryseus]|uniref:hypothetical protein n=1 Tax=Streptomyces chryseus TaxID=68186 RepID=UPI00110FE325|nr:hypothetical protein [Streptomyces chryseus]
MRDAQRQEVERAVVTGRGWIGCIPPLSPGTARNSYVAIDADGEDTGVSTVLPLDNCGTSGIVTGSGVTWAARRSAPRRA